MRVGVVTTSYPRAPGDPAGSFVAAHVDWLARAGHAVEVLCAAAVPPQTHTAWQPGVRVVPVSAPTGLFYQGGAPEALDMAGPAAVADVARFSAALVHAVGRHARGWDAAFAHWLVPCAAALALAAPPRLRLVAIAHSGDVHLLRRLGLTTPVAASLALRRARLACVSEHVRARFLAGVWPARLRRALRARSIVTPMGIDLARWQAAAQAARREPGVRTVLFLGRLVPIKGAAVLLEAAARLPAACVPVRVPVRVIVAGDGPLRPALAAQARALGDRCEVALVGEVRGADRDRLVATADVLVVPSLPVAGRTEGAPVTVLEAMAAGVPVIASRTGGLAELPADTATLVEPGNAENLARHLARCLLDDALRSRQIAAAARWVAQHDWSRVGARLWALTAG
jgi:glycosyltransferase involved in cell wall biosynthesis